MTIMIRSALTVALLAGIAAAPVRVSAGEAAASATVGQVLPAIRVVLAQRREIVETVSVNGTIVAREEAAVGTDLNGMVVQALNADQGDRVRKGDVLALLDRSMLDTQLAQMRATRAQAEASAAQMEAQIADARVGVKQAGEALQRAEALKQKGVAAQMQLDNAVNAADSARAKLDSAVKALAATEAQLSVIDAQIRGVEVQIEKAEVRAPADGLVLSRAATLGGIVSSSSGPLFRIAIDGEFELEANVAETVLPRLTTGMGADVIVPGAAAPVAGSIRRISPEIDASTRLGPIRIALPKDSPARVGGFARATIELTRRDSVAVPVSSVLYRGETPLLQVVADGRVKTTPVQLGARGEGFVEVLSGVAGGDEVVARAGTFVADGDAVSPVRSESTGAITK